MSMKRVMNKTIDANDAQASGYNELSGAFKQLTAGPKLKYLGVFNAAKSLDGFGKQLAIWTAGATDTVTMGAAGVTSLALGAGGIPLEQSKWNYLATGEDQYLIASSATVYVFEILDDTEMRK